jgi:hypothetical protein
VPPFAFVNNPAVKMLHVPRDPLPPAVAGLVDSAVEKVRAMSLSSTTGLAAALREADTRRVGPVKAAHLAAIFVALELDVSAAEADALVQNFDHHDVVNPLTFTKLLDSVTYIGDTPGSIDAEWQTILTQLRAGASFNQIAATGDAATSDDDDGPIAISAKAPAPSC